MSSGKHPENVNVPSSNVPRTKIVQWATRSHWTGLINFRVKGYDHDINLAKARNYVLKKIDAKVVPYSHAEDP